MSNINTFKDRLKKEKEKISELSSLTSSSKVSIWNFWIYLVSFLANNLLELYALHQKEITELIDNQKLGSLNYYRNLALNFRDGHSFDREKLEYVGAYTDEEIEQAKKVKRAAIQSITVEGRKKLFLKLATEDSDGNLAKIDEDVLNRISKYMYPNVNAGTYIEYFSDEADELKLELDVYIDNTILSIGGERIDGTSNAPIVDSIQNFFADKNFKFDGELILSQLENEIQKVEGVDSEAVRFLKAEVSYQTPASWEEIKSRYTARSGYYNLKQENLKINYLVK